MEMVDDTGDWRRSLQRYKSLRTKHMSTRSLTLMLLQAEGRYDFAIPGYLNVLNPDIEPTSFRDWFLHNWASIP